MSVTRTGTLLLLLLTLAGGCGEADWADAEASRTAGLEAYEGEFEIMVHDHIDGSATEHRLLRLDERNALELDFADSDEETRSLAERLSSGDSLQVHGRWVDDRIVVSRLEFPGSSDEIGTLSQATVGLANRSAAVILVGFNGTANTYDPSAVRNAVFGTTGKTTNTFYLEGSRGRMRLVGIKNPQGGDVFGPYTVPYTSCNDAGGFGNVGNAARKLADADGANTSAYNHVIHLLAPNSGCPGGGVASGSRYTWLFGIHINSVWDFTAHEVGHNFGLPHSAWYQNCTSRSGSVVTRSGSCGHDEYGDPTDVMGRRNYLFSSIFLERLRWLDSQNILVTDRSRRVTLAPVELSSTGVQSLRIPRAGVSGSDAFYHLEYRQRLGAFDSGLESSLTNGVLLRVVGDPTVRYTPHLLDMTPGSRTGSSDTLDSTLVAGSSFVDGNVRLNVVELTANHATVDVIIDGVPPGDDSSGSSTVYLEAECATTATGNYTNVYTTESGYSGSGHIRSAANSTSSTFSTSSSPDRATYTVSNVKAGSYKLWFRVDTNGSGNDDSWFYRVDNGSWASNNNHSSSTSWQWVQGAGGTIALSAGTHTIEIANREDGLNIDKIALLPASASAPSGSGGTANNCGPEIGVYYSVKYRHSGKCLDVASSSTANGANVQQYSCLGSPNQKLKLEDRGGGYYALVFQHSGQCIDVASVSTADGANVLQWPCHYNDNQLFQLIDHDNGYYSFKYKHSGKCVDVNAASVDNNANVIQWACHNNSNQQFEFVQ